MTDSNNIWVHLNHPCKEIDVCEEEGDLSGQGYIGLDELRKIVKKYQRSNQRYFDGMVERTEEPTP
jgi:hypothetical protein